MKSPLRKGKTPTITAIEPQFTGLAVRNAYEAKSGQFAMPMPAQDQRMQC